MKNTYNKVCAFKKTEWYTVKAEVDDDEDDGMNWYSLEMRPLNTLHSLFEINFIKGMIRTNGRKKVESLLQRKLKKSSSIIIIQVKSFQIIDVECGLFDTQPALTPDTTIGVVSC